jgi:hypothetical protein
LRVVIQEIPGYVNVRVCNVNDVITVVDCRIMKNNGLGSDR